MARGQQKFQFIISAKNRTKKVFKAIKGQVKGITSSLFSLKGVVVGLAAGAGGGLLAKSFLDAARTTENYRVRLEVLTGSQEKANQLFQDMTRFASKVPFEYEEMMGAATQLGGVLDGNVQQINQWIPRIANLAAATGLGIQETTEQISRMLSAGAGSADLFRERGILAMLGFKAGVKTTAEETRAQLVKMLDDPTGRFIGATDKMANTWDGLMSMMSDTWFSFRDQVMSSGPFQAMKAVVKGLLAEVDKLKSSGKFDEVATSFGQKIIGWLKKGLQTLPNIALGLIKAVEMLFLALTGWKQLVAAFQVVFLNGKIYGLEFINQLRLAFVRLLEGINAIPGVDTSQAISATFQDIGQTISNQEALRKQLESAEVALGKLQIAQDETKASFDSLADDATAAMTRVAKVGLGAIDDAQKMVKEESPKVADKVVSDADRMADAYVRAASAINIFIDRQEAVARLSAGIPIGGIPPERTEGGE